MWKQTFYVLGIFLAVYDCYHHNPDIPIVETSNGAIKGSILTTVLGRRIFSFRGIRYAQPPVGELRFKPPTPVKKWNHVYDATKDGPACAQPFVAFQPVSEDCLFLNVYTTKLPTPHDRIKRPVIFYMHPGGFYSLTGNSVWAGPQYLLDQDVVLVSISYRLASLGLLSTGDHYAPGNLAFKDQVLALKWVRDNIADFGGNPSLVTLLGYSAGAWSITLHHISPMSRGLFHRGVIMSASGYGREEAPHDQLDIAKQQARMLNCPDDASAKILKCLKTKSSEELSNTFYNFQRDGISQILIWQHVQEPNCGQERFLTGDPAILVECGYLENVPIMAGVTYKEFASAAYYIAYNETLRTKLDKNFETLSPYLFNYERQKDSKYISSELRKFYLGNGPLNNASAEGLAKLYADALTGYPINRAVVQISANSKKPVYYYRFEYEGRFSFYYPPGTTTPNGVVHHDDLMYLFHISYLFPLFNQTDPEFHMMRKYTKLIANFALTGNPTPNKDSAFDNVIWEPFKTHSNAFMQINKKMTMNSNFFKERYDLWNKLFPIPKCKQ